MREKEESRKRAIEEKRAEREEKARRVKENLKHQEQCGRVTWLGTSCCILSWK